ncbi:MAG: heavy metal translocating P-type ATPase [Clostridia bacterium]|nr:heavy metal translocating P-type ATPase [Clostridia bacterium]
MRKYNITGMSCAACSARVEKAVSAVEGVESCSVNLLTNSMSVEGTAREQDIVDAVIGAGYGVEAESENRKTEKTDTGEMKSMKTRLFSSLVFLAVLMYVSMGHIMWGFPLPKMLAQNPMALGLVQLLLTAVVMVINQKFFVNGFKGLIKKSPNMDTLVALGSGAAFVYSTYVLFAMSGELVLENVDGAMHHLHDLYFESGAMILTLITVGKLLEARSKGKTTDALRGLMNLSPKTAVAIRDGKELTIPAEQIVVGDLFVVRPGESVPTDGVIVDGSTAIDESALTGESIPVDKSVGDSVTGATVNRFGYIRCRATAVAEDTMLSKIIKTVSEAAASKAPIAKAADKVSGVFVPVVMTIAVITAAIWLILGETAGFAIARGISVLVISCPCALGLATPVAIMVGSGVGARRGILFKTAAALEETGRIKIVALDKTGTVTKGEPEVTDVVSFGVSEEQLMRFALSAELKSEHPLAKAIVKKAEDMDLTPVNAEEFEVLPGNGIKAVVEGRSVVAGNLRFIKEFAGVENEEERQIELFAEQGKTPMCFCVDGRLVGVIAVADKVKEDSCDAVKELKELGIRVVMITGDNQKTANAIAKQVGIETVVAEVLPDGKNSEIRKLMKDGKVAMVGDGINDAPALMAANTGIAIGAGADIAIDAADVVLMKSSLMDVAASIRLSRATLRNIHQNLFWAFVYNTVGIPLAAGLLIPIGLTLNPMVGAAAMSLSSFCVVTNALRLNAVKLYKTKKTKGEEKMKKTLKIEGMMCPHCEANVKNTLEGIEGVTLAEVSHKSGSAVVELSANVASDVLKQAVEEKGYKVISVE